MTIYDYIILKRNKYESYVENYRKMVKLIERKNKILCSLNIILQSFFIWKESSYTSGLLATLKETKKKEKEKNNGIFMIYFKNSLNYIERKIIFSSNFLNYFIW